MRPRFVSIENSLSAKLRKIEGGCWLWTGRLDSEGYGFIWIGKRPQRLVHRVAYEHYVGPIPAGLVVDHMCWVRNCCNPEHLQLLTPSENSRRQRPFRKEKCIRGHDLAGAPVYSGKRACRECNRINAAKYSQRKRLQKQKQLEGSQP